MEIFFIISLLVVVVFLCAYIRYLISRYTEVSEDLYSINVLVGSYLAGLSSIYESEVFYGEPVVEKLVENTRDLDRELSFILEAYGFDDVESQLGEEGDA